MRELRILGLGDSHVEEGPRFEECVRVHDGIVDIAEREKPDLIVHAGDIHDKASTPYERMYSSSLCRRLADVATLLIGRGNHDRRFDLAIMARLKAKHPIVVCETAQVVGHFNLGVALMAWPSRASALDEDVVRRSTRNVLAGLGQELAPYRQRLLVGHFMTEGALSGAGQPLCGDALSVGLPDLALAGAHAVIMGHIHKAQEWEFEGAPILYTGSPFRTDFGEMEPKSVTMLSIGESDRGDLRVSFERIPTLARPMIHGEAVWPEDEGGWVWVSDSSWLRSQDLDVRNADIRFRYHVQPSLRNIAKAEAEALRKELLGRGAADVKLEEVTIVTTRSRAPEVAAAHSLPDKVQALWRARGDVPEPKRATRLLGRVAQLEATP